ncbi:MAG: hypothetical protein H6728_15515 [Myxococcales bacterium]|nr:hypothetical protein [Myxococcales bacterium]MCB9644480.1 hypothetical protein [Myxococcales bacterium]
MKPLYALLVASVLLTACERHDHAGPRTPIPIPPHGISDVVGRRPGRATPPPAPKVNSQTTADGLAVAGIKWTNPKGWRLQRSRSPMRLATYFLPAHADGVATCALYYFGRGQGGSVQANLNRWAGQFAKDPKTQMPPTPSIKKSQYNGLSVHTIEILGTYTASMGPMVKGRALSGQRMLGAIVEAPAGPVFFKCVGPDRAIQEARTNFQSLLNSLQRKP